VIEAPSLPHSDNTPQNDGAKLSASVRFEWKLTETAFNKLLLSLSPDREEAANRYELLRRKLIRFCESNTSVPADEGADEIINRVTRKLDEGTFIPNIFAYSFGVARMVLKEFWKERERSHLMTRELPTTTTVTIPVIEERDDARLRCFDTCLERLSSESRKLIMDYYREDRHAKIELRKELAQQLSIPLNALRIRAHRVRRALEECCKECLATARSH
jgi:DNA-directed RNA polymerase specialized sigma24 family protein